MGEERGKIQIGKENVSLSGAVLVNLVINETTRTSRWGWGTTEGKSEIGKENFSLRGTVLVELVVKETTRTSP